MNGRESRAITQIRGRAMRREHDILRQISSNRPIDETIHRGFVDAVRQSPDMAGKTTVAGHAYPLSADKTLNSQPSHGVFATVGGFAHS
jgi:hypothetical protein